LPIVASNILLARRYFYVSIKCIELYFTNNDQMTAQFLIFRFWICDESCKVKHKDSINRVHFDLLVFGAEGAAHCCLGFGYFLVERARRPTAAAAWQTISQDFDPASQGHFAAAACPLHDAQVSVLGASLPGITMIIFRSHF
jgi:hypothetical protein